MSIDILIDRYLAHERLDRPRLGYPSKAAGTSLHRSSRQWQESNETLDEASQTAELQAMEGAWASLTFSEERLLRADSRMRNSEFPIPFSDSTRESLGFVKKRLTKLLEDRGIFLANTPCA